MAKRDYLSEILDRRQRLAYYAPIAELGNRFMNLELEFIRADKLSDEMMRYFPIAIVACMESFFRLTLADLIDNGPPFSDRIVDFDNVRVDLPALKAVHGRRVTLGEFVSHLLPLQSLPDINKAFSCLLADDFLERIRLRHENPLNELARNARDFVSMTAGEVFAAVEETVRLRNIYAHEFASSQRVDRGHIRRCFNASMTLMLVATQVVDEATYPDAPHTLEEAENMSSKMYRDADDQLKKVSAQVIAALPEDLQQRLTDVQNEWRAVRDGFAGIYGKAKANRYQSERLNELYIARYLTVRRADELQFLLDPRQHGSAA